MTPERERLVRDSWAVVRQTPIDVAGIFYDRLFALDPAARALFAGVDMAAQGAKFVVMLGAIVHALDQAPVLVTDVAALARRHMAYGAWLEHHEAVGAALLWTLERVLGAAWTPEVRAGWAEAYALITALARRAAVHGAHGAHGAPAA